jgi:hypothetical protein
VVECIDRLRDEHRVAVADRDHEDEERGEGRSAFELTRCTVAP